jgi:hypothetical protein
MVSRHLQGCNPRLSRLRTDGLAPASKYLTYRSHAGDMSSVSLVASCRQRVALPLTASLAGSGEKLGIDPQIGQPAYWGLCRESLFSGAVTLSIVVNDFVKCCQVRASPAGSVHGLTWEAYMSC